MTTEETPKKLLKFEEYKKLIKEDIQEYNELINNIKSNYIDSSELLGMFKLRPMNYFEYCKNNNYEPETDEKEFVEKIYCTQKE